MEANSKAVNLTDEDLKGLNEIIKALPVAGERYGGVHEKYLNA